jgi:hypothetical protein
MDVVRDLTEGDPTSLDLLKMLAERGATAPLLGVRSSARTGSEARPP